MFGLQQWRRIYDQTLTLTYKNLLVFCKSPVVSFIKALLVPIIITIIFCFLKEINSGNGSPGGISHTGRRLMDLPDAMSASSSQRLVFVTNDIQDAELNNTINALRKDPGMAKFDTQIIDDPITLFDACKQSIHGTSDCFASVMFTSFNKTRAEYTIVVDEDFLENSPSDYKSGQSALSQRLLPLKWAMDSHIGGFESKEKPTEKMWSGFFGGTDTSAMETRTEVYWLSLVQVFAAPLFVFILLIATHHTSSTVAGERQNSVAELLMAQGVTTPPRILSNMFSFCALYTPGVIICSILLGEILFVTTSTGIIFILMLLASIAFIVCAHFMGSFFSKASIAGLCTAVLTFAIGLITLAQNLTAYGDPSQKLGLSLVFPPYAWATLIADIATAESVRKAFPDKEVSKQSKSMDGNLFFVCFILHIIIYGAGTFLVEHFRWGVPKQREWTENSDEVALRLGHLSKTFAGGKQAVNDLSVEVQKGSVTFLLGPNGSGKTTALKCISGMLKVDDGSRIQFSRNGHSFGLCPQNNVLWDVLSVSEHVRIWARLKTAGSGGSSTEDIDNVIAECDLTGKAHAPSETLSGGQKRRLQLAIAFSGGSQVCCIDEASSGLARGLLVNKWLQDPLSRRNIWNIIQEGRRQRTTVLTTHFLDEADVLADHIVIMCKGRLVCQGSSIALKSQHGDSYRIRVDGDDEVALKATTSAEATKTILGMESQQDDLACHITFPTLEQVFLKTTSEFGTAINENGGDGMVDELETVPEDSNAAVEDKILALESEYNGEDLNLDVGRSVGILRQIWVLFRKRYQLLLRISGLIVYAVNLFIPIIVAAALTKFMYKWDALVTCDATYQQYINPTGVEIPPLQNQKPAPVMGSGGAILGPELAFLGAVQDEIYTQSIGWMYPSGNGREALNDRKFVNTPEAFERAMDKSTGLAGFGAYVPSPGSTIFYHTAESTDADSGLAAFSLITNRMANSTSSNQARHMTTKLRTMRHVNPVHDWRNMPIAILLVIVLVASVSTAVIYPMYERVSKVRALQYSNGVSPFALWAAYLLFDAQFIIVEALIVYGLLFVHPIKDIWYRPDCIFGAIILFGIASYLGTYLLSNIFRRGGFAAALGIHIVLAVLYIIGYVAGQFGSPADDRQDIYDSLQEGLGLIVPAGNLARALFIGMNTFDVLCGKYGDADTSYPFAYDRYGGVYANLIYQIIFLVLALGLSEYGSADWFRPLFFWRRRVPARLRHNIDDGGREGLSFDSRQDIMLEQPKTTNEGRETAPILAVDRVSKHFGRTFAAQNVSLSISANETLALLGGNGAGKTAVINMIRGEVNPDFGDIYVNSVSVLRQARKARLNIGVCPQDDAVDNLTVRQTLEFYAAVKGLQRIKENVSQVMNALDITPYEKVTAKALSGGTKRKLTVAIALLGNPPLLLLDEPSTGQDAGAKRILWRALKRIRANRAILLTTHSMEEAESLASHLAIMRTRLLVSGTLSSLNDLYGGAFRLRGVRCANVSSDVAREEVKSAFADMGQHVMQYVDMNGLVQFFVKYDKKVLGRVMATMEGLKGASASSFTEEEEQGDAGSAGQVFLKVFEDYTLIEPTLEEVFMNVVKEAEGSEGL